jgi:aminocarboxymuconate-semialdehyde decarboxylase
VSGGARLARHGLANALGFPADVALAAAELMLGGVLARHPALRVLLAHGGGALLAVLPRLAHVRVVTGDGGDPHAGLGRFTFDSITHDAGLLRGLLDAVGPEQVAFGTDYPSELGDVGGRMAREVVATLDAGARDRVLAGTAFERLGVRAPAAA